MKDLFKDDYIHAHVNYKYFGESKYQTFYLDVSNLAMQVEHVLTPKLLELSANCENHVEAATYLFVLNPGFIGGSIATISKILDLDSINIVGRHDVTQLHNYLERVNNEDLRSTFDKLRKKLIKNIYIKDKTAFLEVKRRLEEITVHSYEIDEGVRTLVFESNGLSLFEKNRPFSEL